MTVTYQRPTAEEDHEDDKGLKPVMLNNSEAGSPDVPPDFTSTFGYVHSETWPAQNTCFRQRNMKCIHYFLEIM